jgi:hypothetical protein
MEQWHIYSNAGTLDLRAITVMGMNAKNSEGAIGYFGTGLKYAIATLKRHDCDIHISDGQGNSWAVESRPTTFRGHEFKELVLEPTAEGDPIPLPFTTDLGKDWKLWMALREIESNMRDEDGNYRTAVHLNPQPNVVQIAIRGAAYNTCVVQERDTIFYDRLTEGHAVHTVGNMQMATCKSKYAYVNGIRATKETNYGLAINVMAQGLLSEDRMLNNHWSLYNRVHAAACHFTPAQWELFAGNVVDCDLIPFSRLEQDMRGHKEARANGKGTEAHLVPLAVYRILSSRLTLGHIAGMTAEAIGGLWTDYELSAQDTEIEGNRDMLDTAIQFLNDFAYDIERKDITVKRSLGVGIMGLYDGRDGKIYLAQEVFDRGQSYLNTVLHEELLHKVYGFKDETRAFQSHLMHALTSRMEEINRIERWANKKGYALPTPPKGAE